MLYQLAADTDSAGYRIGYWIGRIILVALVGYGVRALMHRRARANSSTEAPAVVGFGMPAGDASPWAAAAPAPSGAWPPPAWPPPAWPPQAAPTPAEAVPAAAVPVATAPAAGLGAASNWPPTQPGGEWTAPDMATGAVVGMAPAAGTATATTAPPAAWPETPWTPASLSWPTTSPAPAPRGNSRLKVLLGVLGGLIALGVVAGVAVEVIERGKPFSTPETVGGMPRMRTPIAQGIEKGAREEFGAGRFRRAVVAIYGTDTPAYFLLALDEGATAGEVYAELSDTGGLTAARAYGDVACGTMRNSPLPVVVCTWGTSHTTGALFGYTRDAAVVAAAATAARRDIES